MDVNGQFPTAHTTLQLLGFRRNRMTHAREGPKAPHRFWHRQSVASLRQRTCGALVWHMENGLCAVSQ